MIADLNDHNMPEFIHQLTNKQDFNLRTLSAQTLSVASIEVLIGIYMGVRYYKSDFSKDQLAFKKQKILLASHAVEMAFNIGKIYATGNPYYLNMPQVLRIAKLAFNVVVENSRQTHNAKESALLSQIKAQLQLQKTLVLLSDACYLQNELSQATENNLVQTHLISSNNDVRTRFALTDLRKKLSQI